MSYHGLPAIGLPRASQDGLQSSYSLYGGQKRQVAGFNTSIGGERMLRHNEPRYPVVVIPGMLGHSNMSTFEGAGSDGFGTKLSP